MKEKCGGKILRKNPTCDKGARKKKNKMKK